MIKYNLPEIPINPEISSPMFTCIPPTFPQPTFYSSLQNTYFVKILTSGEHPCGTATELSSNEQAP